MSLVKLANEFEEEQERSRWRNTGYGAGIGAGLGLLGGAAMGIGAARADEKSENDFLQRNYQNKKQGYDWYQDIQKAYQLKGEKLIPPTEPTYVKLKRGPFLVGGAATGAAGLGMLGAGVGATTDVIRNINQMPQEKTASYTMSSLYK